MTEGRSYLQKYAMHFGTYMGIYWILKFILFPLGVSIPFLLFLFVGLTMGVPFMGYYYACIYRDKICGGSINFLQAWVFTVFMYMFAALLTAVVHFIYFRFIDHGFIAQSYIALLQDIDNTNVPDKEVYTEALRDALDTFGSLTPIDITLQFVSHNVFCGSLLAIPTALFVMRKPKSTEI